MYLAIHITCPDGFPNSDIIKRALYETSDNFMFAHTSEDGQPTIVGIAEVKSELVYTYGEYAHKFKELVGQYLATHAPACKLTAHKCTRHAANEIQHELFDMKGFFSSF